MSYTNRKRYIIYRDSDGTYAMSPIQQRLTTLRSGTSVPNWRQKIASQQDASSSFSSDVVTQTIDKPGRLDFSEASYTFNGAGQVISVNNRLAHSAVGYAYRLSNFLTDNGLSVGPLSQDAAVDSAMIARAKTKLLSRLRNERQGMDGLVFLGELRETVHLLRHPADSLRRYVSDTVFPGFESAKKGVKRRVKPRKSDTPQSLQHRRRQAFRDVAANQWLEYAYGIRPFISDCKDIVQTALRSMTEANDRRIKVLRASAESDAVRDPAYNGPGTWTTTGANTLDRKADWYKASRASILYRLGYKQDVRAPAQSMERLAELSGLSLERIVPTLWELTPYSFLVDYFLNVGNILDAAFTSLDGVVWANYTTKQWTTFRLTGSWRVRVNNSNPRYINEHFSSSLDEREFVRKTTVRVPIAPSSLLSIPLTFSIPGIDSTRWINMAALLSQHTRVRF